MAAEAEEEIAIAVLAGDCLGHGAERLVDLALELKAFLKDLPYGRYDDPTNPRYKRFTRLSE